MTTLKNLPVDDLNMLLYVVQQSFSVRRHFQLFSWLQDEVQQFLPHEIMIAAWGDFRSGDVCYDIISPLPGIRTGDFDSATVLALMAPLFLRWHECGHTPYMVTSSGGFAQTGTGNPRADDAMTRMQACLVHGIKDQRGRHDCIYALLGPTELGCDRSKLTMRFLLPYIDTGSEFGQTVLIAWKDSAASARAVTAALPVLRLAKSVHVAAWDESGSPGDGEPLPIERFLQRHGVHAKVHRGGRPSGEVGELLLSLAADVQADLLVMGCYGHSRAREWLLGGVTRTIFQSMTLPVLMSH